jgi:hypothetical protein
MNSTSGFPLNVEIPVVSCDICRHESFYPPGIWHGSWKGVPPVIQLQAAPARSGNPAPVFHIVGCASQAETKEAALVNGWRMVQLRASIKLVCPACQALISECVGLWERS